MIRKERLFVFFLPLLLSLPFLNRAYFVDDSYFVEIASWLKDHPSLPYHFRTDDAGLQNRGWEENGFVRMVNPLAHHYYLAGLLKLAGEREWFLRLGCVFLSCFSALFIFGLARRWTNDPFLSTVLVLVTPVQWLTAHSLLIDSTLLFFFVGGLFFFIRATEKDSLPLFSLSGVFMGLALLTKYPGIFVLPLTVFWCVLRRKKFSKKIGCVVAWIIAVLFLAAFSLYTADVYGESHILAASKRMVHVFGWPKILSFFVFFSGSTLLPLLSWGIAKKRERWFGALAILFLTLFFSSSIGSFTVLQGFLLGLWLLTSLFCLAYFWQVKPFWIFPRDHFIFAWVVGFAGMMLLVMNWVAVRYYTIGAPALVFMVVRLVEIKRGEFSRKILPITCVVMFLFTSLLAYADFKQAEPSRHIGGQLKLAGYEGGDRHFYLGDSFTMSYMRRQGWIPAFPDTDFQVGDLILAKEVTMPLVWFAKKPVVLEKLKVFNYPAAMPIKVMDYRGSAGFYASVWGALPFTFSTGPWERFHLFKVINKKNEPS